MNPFTKLKPFLKRLLLSLKITVEDGNAELQAHSKPQANLEFKCIPQDGDWLYYGTIHFRKSLKIDSVNSFSCRDNSMQIAATRCGLTGCLLTTSEKTLMPQQPTTPPLTFPTSHQRSGQTV